MDEITEAESKQTGRFLVIPLKLLKNTEISHTQKFLLSAIYNLSNQRGYCFGSNRYLGEMIGLTKQTAANNVSKLIQAGMLESKVIRNDLNEIVSRKVWLSRKARVFFGIPYYPEREGGSSDKEQLVDEKLGGPNLGIGNYTNKDSILIKQTISIRDDESSLPTTNQKQLPAKTSKPKTSVCSKASIERETLEKIIQHPNYGNGDAAFVGLCFQQMLDWSRAGAKRKADWAATLRNWILSERKRGFHPHSGNQKPRAKTFEELEEERMKEASRKFLERAQKKSEVSNGCA